MFIVSDRFIILDLKALNRISSLNSFYKKNYELIFKFLVLLFQLLILTNKFIELFLRRGILQSIVYKRRSFFSVIIIFIRFSNLNQSYRFGNRGLRFVNICYIFKSFFIIRHSSNRLLTTVHQVLFSTNHRDQSD